MQFKEIRKVHEGRFITRYDIDYELVDGNTKTYEMISRSKDLKNEHDVVDAPIDSVILMLTDETGERLLLDREFRLATGRFVYNFPAGLIDPGETPEEAAARELREETGLELVSIEDRMHVSYGAVGFSNEKNVCIVGTARGEFHASTSAEEEIKPGWYTKAEVRELLQNEYFSARTQAYSYLWSKE